MGTPTASVAQVTVNPKALEPLGGGSAPLSGANAVSPHPEHRRMSAHRRHRSERAKPVAPATAEQKPSSAKPAESGKAEPGKVESGKAGSGKEEAKRPSTTKEEAKQPSTTENPAIAPTSHSLVHEPPVVPLAPPPVATLAPLSPPPPSHPAPPPRPAPVVAGAAGEVLPIPDGLRLTFGAGSADLNPETDAALQKLAHDTAAKPGATVTVLAYAAGSLDDPSTPRRLALSRALAARTVLLAAGVNSTHIYLRALGSNSGEGPPDRVDVTVTAPVAAKPAQ
jgi:outer membrane protein OmpA-like peptidoglycan-associated protein